MAFHGRGAHINLNDVPPFAVEWVTGTMNRLLEEEVRRQQNMPR
jgi:hypothetical protein